MPANEIPSGCSPAVSVPVEPLYSDYNPYDALSDGHPLAEVSACMAANAANDTQYVSRAPSASGEYPTAKINIKPREVKRVATR